MTRPVVVILALCAVGVGADLLVAADVPGYGSWIGIGGTVLLTFLAKAMAGVIRRPGDAYAGADLPDPMREGEDGG